MTDTIDTKRRRTRRILIGSGIAVVLSTLLSATVIAPWVDRQRDPQVPKSAELQETLDSLVDEGFPGALAAVTSPTGKVTDYTAGVAELGSDTAPPSDGYVRIGSNTKMFTAVIILQLVDDGLVELDEPVASYLPGLLESYDIDGTTITVRQLLQHTSGLPNYTGPIVGELDTTRYQYMSPRDLVDIAFTMPVSFAPGEKWEYSNTNYILAGLIAEKVTGRPLVNQITERIIEPLQLTETSFPEPGDTTMPEPHAVGYYSAPGEKAEDFTTLDPSWAWAAGQMIATPSDLNRFMIGLLDGKLMSDDALDEMQSTIPAPDLWEGAEYGLGLTSYPLSCGGVAWGHGGDIPGYETRNAATADGRAATIAVTNLPGSITADEDEAYRIATDVSMSVDVALCE